MPTKEILKSGQLNIELGEEEIAVFREIDRVLGISPQQMVRALITKKLAEYRATKELRFTPPAIPTQANSNPVEEEIPSLILSRTTAQESKHGADRISPKTAPTAAPKREKP